MAESLGEKLRAAREERGISISEVAEQTRIAPMYLESIENDNYKPLPGGIFNKGFVRSYARYVGVDEQEALREYTQLIAGKGDGEMDALPAYKPEVLTDDRARQSTLPTILFAGLILALMTGGVLFLVNYLQNRSETQLPTANRPSNTNTEPSVASSTEPAAPTGTVPTMETLKVDFMATTESISLSATSDGKNSVNVVNPGTSVSFEPRESLRLSYAKDLSAFAKLVINGREIGLPAQPANPKRVAIEIELNKDNISRVWTNGQYTFETPAPETVTAKPTPAARTSTETAPSPTAEANAAPSPAVPKPTAAATVKPTPTPIVVGRSGNTNSAKPPAKPTPRSTPD